MQPADDAVLIDTTELSVEDVEQIVAVGPRPHRAWFANDAGGAAGNRSRRAIRATRTRVLRRENEVPLRSDADGGGGGVTASRRRLARSAIWSSGRVRSYGLERPLEGGIVPPRTTFRWIDRPPSAACPRRIHFLAKAEAWRAGSRSLLLRTTWRSGAASPIASGRPMRDVARDGGRSASSSRARGSARGVPVGVRMPGAAMVALQEDVPVLPVAIHGTRVLETLDFHPVAVAWKPILSTGCPRRQGLPEAAGPIEHEIRRLWDWLVDVHAKGRPTQLTVPP